MELSSWKWKKALHAGQFAPGVGLQDVIAVFVFGAAEGAGLVGPAHFGDPDRLGFSLFAEIVGHELAIDGDVVIQIAGPAVGMLIHRVEIIVVGLGLRVFAHSLR